jgi:putative ABC transport system permease protein
MDADVGHELAFHFQQLVQEYAAEGMPLDEARYAARRTLGNHTLLTQECRDQRRVAWLHDFWQDVRFGARMLRKNSCLTAITALSLALGIGANTAILGTLGAIKGGPLPFRDPDRLVAIQTISLKHSLPAQMASLPDFFAWRERQHSFESIGVSLANQADLQEGDSSDHLFGRLFSPDLFATLGIHPALGRLFYEDEYQADKAGTVVIITHRLWQDHFGGDSGIIGKQVRMDSKLRQIVGVLPAYFPYSEERVDYFIPMVLRPPQANTERYFQVTARLRAGVTLEQAQADMRSIGAQLAQEYPERNKGWSVLVQPEREFLFGWTQQPLWTLEAAVILMLIIVCSNVAGLLLARATARDHEISMRAALGAGRGRIVRQLLTESLMISLIGGALAIAVAYAGLTWVATATPPSGRAHLDTIPLDLRLVALNALTAILTGVGFGLVPALVAFRSNLAVIIQQSARPSGGQRAKLQLRGTLVAAQVAVAMVLVTGTGLLAKSFLRVTARELNFDSNGLLSFEVRIPQFSYMRLIGVFHDWNYFELQDPPQRLLENVRLRLAALPEAKSVAGISNPLVNSLVLYTLPVQPEGPHRQDAPTAGYFLITPNFFATVRTQLHGREFDTHDTADTPWVAVVNETAVKHFWPEMDSPDDAIGKTFTFDTTPEERPRKVVGVVRDIPTRIDLIAPNAVVYVPYTQQPPRIGPWGNLIGQMTYLVRVRGDRDPLTVAEPARRAVAEIAPDRPISNITTVTQYTEGRLPESRIILLVLGTFAAVSALLAAMGVYGVMSYDVAHRTREIGVRLALGASASELILSVGRRSFLLIAVGLAVGLAGAAALGQLLSSQLWQVAPQDPETLAGCALLIAIVAAGACYLPARTAVSLDPTIALRCE